MILRPPRSTLFPTRRSSDLIKKLLIACEIASGSKLPEFLLERRIYPVRNRSIESSQKETDRKSTRLNSSHANISYAVFCLKKKKTNKETYTTTKQKTIQKHK